MWKRRNFDWIEEITFFKSELKQGPKRFPEKEVWKPTNRQTVHLEVHA